MQTLQSYNRATSTVALPPDKLLRDYYRYPEGLVDISLAGQMEKRGFFRFGSAICFGTSALNHSKDTFHTDDELPESLERCSVGLGSVHLPFDLNEVVTNLRCERYVAALSGKNRKLADADWIRRAYYLVRKFMPISVRKHLQRAHLADWERIPFPKWPVDCSVDVLFEKTIAMAVQARAGEPVPFVWFWPDGHDSCMIMTHDVEQAAGRDFCPTLMEMVESVGLRSSFQVIPEERYQVPPDFLHEIRRRGHEVNIHDLNHDGHLYRERTEFLRKAARIAEYARQFGAEGFRSAILYRNPEWYEALEFLYDMSVPNVAHLDPQRGGCCTVMPYFIGHVLELPLTTTQDYSLFHILNNFSLALWEEQIGIIRKHHGLISFNIHPDYVEEQRASDLYQRLLVRLASIRDEHRVWAALPRDVNRWWRLRSKMEVARTGYGWKVVGEGSERARIAYACLDGGRLTYRRD
jgi:hypothetical protein